MTNEMSRIMKLNQIERADTNLSDAELEARRAEDAKNAEGYDADHELAQHMVYDCGQYTPWALDQIGEKAAIEWERDDDRLISLCGRYEIVEDATYGFQSLRFDGDLLFESASLSDAQCHARGHQAERLVAESLAKWQAEREAKA